MECVLIKLLSRQKNLNHFVIIVFIERMNDEEKPNYAADQRAQVDFLIAAANYRFSKVGSGWK